MSETILIIEDEVKISDVIKSYLEHAGYRTIVANNGLAGLNFYDIYNPDLVLLDLMLPDLSGEEVCKKIRLKSNVPIIMLTAKVEESDVLDGFDYGADDYITKPFSPRQLVKRIQAVLRRAKNTLPLMSIASFNNKDLIIDFNEYQVLKNQVEVVLTASEFKILSLLVKYPKKVFTREELVDMVFGIFNTSDYRIIDTHVKNIRSKIETDTKKPIYILTVHGIGYKFGGENE